MVGKPERGQSRFDGLQQPLDPVHLIITVVIVGVMLYAGTMVWSQQADQVDGDGQAFRLQNGSVALGQAEAWYTVRDNTESATNEEVRNSLGNAGGFDGSGGVSSSVPASVGNMSSAQWTVAQGVWIGAGATGENMTLLSVGAPDVVLAYDGGAGEYRAFVVEQDGITRLNATAPSPTTATVLTLRRNGSTVELWRGDTLTERDTIEPEGGNITQYGNLTGRLDETRVLDTAVSNATISTWTSSPVAAGTDRSNYRARIMWDTTGSGSVRIWFTPGSLGTTGVAVGDGFDGAVMDRAGLVSENDYRWRSTNGELLATESGRLADQPVAFVSADITPATMATKYTRQLEGAMSTITNVFIVLGAVLILSWLLVLRGGR